MSQSKLHLILIFALALLGCSREGKPSGSGSNDDGYAVGQQPLALQEAPPGLCEGEGAEKECEGECVSQPDEGQDSAGNPQAPGFSGGSGASAGTGGFGLGNPGGVGGMGGAGGAGGFGGSGGSSEPIEPDAGCSETLPDGGFDATCGSDAAVASSANALIDDAPTCDTLDSSAPYTLYMSADDSNSMASPVIARRMIRAGEMVPAWLVRSYEFLNYYDFAFEPAASEEVRIVPQLSSCPINGQLSLQVALQAEARDPGQRKPLNLTFVLDTSGSMEGLPIELQRAAMRAIAGQLRAGDVVSMVTWNVDQRDVLTGHAITGPNDPLLVGAIEGVIASGGTDLAGGLVRGYQLAAAQRSAERINRVVLISDGIANVGVTDAALIGQHADDEEGEEGIYLTGIGVGDGVNDTLMNQVTDTGRGAYVYLDSAAEAQRMLGERFLSVVDVAARGVRLEVTLPYYLTLEKFFGEVASTDSSVVRPQHLGPNDAMLFFQVLKACDPSLIHGDDRIKLRATWETPFTRQLREATIDTTLNALAGDDAQLTKAAAIAGYAEALVAVNLSFADRGAIIDQALANVLAAENSATDPDLVEVAALLQRYRLTVASVTD
jgi:Ca-activated chloride channel family protein